MHKLDAPQYLQLNKGGAVARLSILKMRAFEWNEKRPPSLQKDWRKARAYGFHNWHANHGALSKSTQGEGFSKTDIWYTHTGEQFRNEQDAHEINSRIPRGWYTDTEGRDTAIGIVASLPHGRFIAGYRWTSNDERVYFPGVFDDMNEAARRADSHAECFADAAREDSEKWDTARDLDSQNEDALIRLRECLVLRHKECMSYVREEVSELIATIRNNRARLSAEFADYQ